MLPPGLLLCNCCWGGGLHCPGLPSTRAGSLTTQESISQLSHAHLCWESHNPVPPALVLGVSQPSLAPPRAGSLTTQSHLHSCWESHNPVSLTRAGSLTTRSHSLVLGVSQPTRAGSLTTQSRSTSCWESHNPVSLHLCWESHTPVSPGASDSVSPLVGRFTHPPLSSAVSQ